MGDMEKRQDRLAEAYRDAESHLQSLNDRVAEGGPPCRDCRWSGTFLSDNCYSPFIQRGKHNAITGKVRWEHPSRTRARNEKCYNGLLFEPATLVSRVHRIARDLGYGGIAFIIFFILTLFCALTV